MKITFPYPGVPSLEVPDSSVLSHLEPRVLSGQVERETEVIRNSLRNPIGLPALADLATGRKKVLILVDDYTRTTPVHLILPEVLGEMHRAGVKNKDIRILIASGTHRPMTAKEKLKRLGARIMAEYTVLDHHCDDPACLAQLPTTAQGTEIWVNRAMLESDFVLGIGHIVPHRVAGFSGGGKIVQPGACGAVTTGQTHWLSARFEGAQIMGKIDNPVRREIEEVARAAGLSFIVNAVLDGKGNLASCFCGEPVQAYRSGARRALEIFGVPMSEAADIVIADSYPSDMELWQAAKGIYAADLALKPEGVLILVTPCPEGVSVQHPGIRDIGYRPFHELEAMVGRGEIQDLTLAAHLAHVGRVIREKAIGVLVSSGIEPRTAAKIGFHWAADPREALDFALRRKGDKATIAILRNGGEIMPITGEAGSAKER
jgi:nickel-dependent lactate racemase